MEDNCTIIIHNRLIIKDNNVEIKCIEGENKNCNELSRLDSNHDK